mmetsp:Transcript_7643/g.9739  ORF Transcript_7643/g.9739 Transcript_7643/m.9739 type:complete len:268 (-) Transcript_7643:113-916(-)
MSSSSTNNNIDTTAFTVAQLPCLDDNYGYLIHDPKTGDTAAVDTPDASVYEKELTNRGWKLSHIFNTHHHWDHTGGNLELKKDGVKIYGPSENIPGCDVPLNGGDVIDFGNKQATIIDVGGHTKGHIAYHFPTEHTVFVGDSLFALGCGKMFEGTPSQFWASLKRLRELPDETIVYCAHEYTQSNAKFAMSVESGNPKLVARAEEIYAKRQRGERTVPSLMGVEKETNPFLRGDISEEIRKNVGAVDGDTDDVIFGKVRKAKDTFRG